MLLRENTSNWHDDSANKLRGELAKEIKDWPQLSMILRKLLWIQEACYYQEFPSCSHNYQHNLEALGSSTLLVIYNIANDGPALSVSNLVHGCIWISESWHSIIIKKTNILKWNIRKPYWHLQCRTTTIAQQCIT